MPEAGGQIVAKDAAIAHSSLLSEEEYKQLMQKALMRSCPTHNDLITNHRCHLEPDSRAPIDGRPDGTSN